MVCIAFLPLMSAGKQSDIRFFWILYHETDFLAACWKAGEPVPYLHLARTFELVEREKGKIKTTTMLCNMFRRFAAISCFISLLAFHLSYFFPVLRLFFHVYRDIMFTCITSSLMQFTCFVTQ